MSNNEMIGEFVTESLEHLEGIDEKLLEYEKNADDSELIDAIFRSIHTIKGTSGFFHLDSINVLSHQLETVLDQLRKGTRRPDEKVMDLLFQGCDLLRILVTELSEQQDAENLSDLFKEDRRVDDLCTLIRQLDGETGSVEKSNAEPRCTVTAVDPRLMEEFREEAGEHLDNAEQVLVKLGADHGNEDLINEIFRDLHSVKGTSAYLGLQTITDLAHAAETLLDVIRHQDEVRVSEEQVDLLLETVDALKDLVGDPSSGRDEVGGLKKRLLDHRERVRADGSEPEKRNSSEDSAGDPAAIFADSASQHLETLENCLETWEKEKGFSQETVRIMLRAAGSLKSSARFMQYKKIEQEATLIEEALSSVQDGSLEMAQGVVDLVRDSIRIVREEMTHLEPPEIPQHLPASPGKSTPGTGASEHPSDASARPGAPSGNGKSAPVKTMRIDQRLLDTFMNLVGELIVARNALEHIERRIEGTEEERVAAAKDLRKALQSVGRISEEMQRHVMEMRMVPMKTVFQKFPRLARDITRKSGKKVEIVFQGEDTEIDKGIAEDIGDPLVHIVRNSLDHGIEPPEERTNKGKPETGTIIMRAAHEGNMIVIDVLDDGAGINTEAVLEKAIEKGLVSKEEATSLSHEEICDFIFHPGFSTAKEITDISGRGVGMDVVMTNLKRLKGSVRVTSERDKGTQVRLEVPLTLALVEALLVESSAQTFAIPLEAVVETVKITPDRLRSLMQRKAITLRDEIIQIYFLSELLNLPSAESRGETPGEAFTILVLKVGGNRMGIAVDAVHRKEEIVVKPLADYLAGIPGLSGATILGDGRSILILDPVELFALSKKTCKAA